MCKLIQNSFGRMKDEDMELETRYKSHLTRRPGSPLQKGGDDPMEEKHVEKEHL